MKKLPFDPKTEEELLIWAELVENTNKWYPTQVWRRLAKQAAGRLADLLREKLKK